MKTKRMNGHQIREIKGFKSSWGVVVLRAMNNLNIMGQVTNLGNVQVNLIRLGKRININVPCMLHLVMMRMIRNPMMKNKLWLLLLVMSHVSSNSKEEENIDSNLYHKSDNASDEEVEEELDLQTAYD